MEGQLSKLEESHSAEFSKLKEEFEALKSEMDSVSQSLQSERKEHEVAMSARMRDLEQQLKSAHEDRVDMVVRQGQMQKLLEDLIRSQEDLQYELERLKPLPIPESR